MKKILQQKINLGFTLVIAAIIITGITSAAAYSSPGQSPIPLIHESGGDQVIAGLGLGVLPGNNYAAIGNFDLRGPITAALSFFDKSSSGEGFIFSALQNSYFLGKLVIGSTENPDWKIINTQSFFGDDGISFSTPQQKVNVIGNVLSTSLQNTSGQNPVCVEPDGSIVLCDDTTLATTIYSWIVSDWGTCNYQPQCSGTAPDFSYEPCDGEEEAPSNQQQCLSIGNYCSWNENPGTQSRALSCQDVDGNVVSDDLCTGPEPENTRACELEFNWSPECNNEISCTGSYQGPAYKIEPYDSPSFPGEWNPGVVYYVDSANAIREIPAADINGLASDQYCVPGREYFIALQEGYNGPLLNHLGSSRPDFRSKTLSNNITDYYWYRATARTSSVNGSSNVCMVGVRTSLATFFPYDENILGESLQPAWFTDYSCQPANSINSCTSQNAACVARSNGQQSLRNVSCRDVNGIVAPEHLCTEPKPTQADAC